MCLIWWIISKGETFLQKVQHRSISCFKKSTARGPQQLKAGTRTGVCTSTSIVAGYTIVKMCVSRSLGPQDLPWNMTRPLKMMKFWQIRQYEHTVERTCWAKETKHSWKLEKEKLKVQQNFPGAGGREDGELLLNRDSGNWCSDGCATW